MRRFIFAILAVVCYSINSHAQKFTWSKIIGGKHAVYEDIGDIVTDMHKNVYSFANVYDTLLTADTFYSSSALQRGFNSGKYSILLTSYTCGGNMRWARLLECSNVTNLYRMIYDRGNVYVVGRFLDSGAVRRRYFADSFLSNHYQHYFLGCFDTLGHTRWIRFVGADDLSSEIPINADENQAMAVDGQGNIQHLLYLYSGVKIAPGFVTQAGIYRISYAPNGTLIGAIRLNVDSTYRVFGQNFVGQRDVKLTKISINNKSGNLYCVLHKYRVNSSGNLDSARSRVCAFAPTGVLIWEDTLATTMISCRSCRIRDAVYDQNNSIYVAGEGVTGEFALNGFTPNFPKFPGNTISVLTKIDTSGKPLWMASNVRYGNQLTIANTTILPNGTILISGNANGNIYTGGDSIIFPDAKILYPFYAITAPDGKNTKLHGAVRAGNTQFNYNLNDLTASAVDAAGNIYFGGYQDTDTLFYEGGFSFVKSTPSSNFVDAFILRLGIDCRCTAIAKASFKDSIIQERNVLFTYTGTTDLIDSVVWSFGDGQKKRLTSGYTVPFTHTYTSGSVLSHDTIIVRVYSGCGNDSFIKYPTAVGVASLVQTNELQLYPNPAKSSRFSLQYQSAEPLRNAQISITDLTGRLVYSQAISTGTTKIHQDIILPNASPGIYIFELRSANQRTLRKLILQ